MAKNDEKDAAWRRRRKREEEDRETESKQKLNQPISGERVSKGTKPDESKISELKTDQSATQFTATGVGQSEQLVKMIKQALSETERVHSLFVQFFAGAEKTPPIEARRTLDRLLDAIKNSSQMTAAVRFQAQAAISKARTYQERWDKLLKSRETG